MGVLMLPYSDGNPPNLVELAIGITVAFNIGLDLVAPPAPIGLWPCAVEWTTMPKAPVDKDRHPFP